VILAGGHGTRLLPLTANTPKPLIPLVNRPFMDHVLNLLRAHGITDVVLAMAYLSESFAVAYGEGPHLGVKLTYVSEAEPQGTGGAIKNVEAYLDTGETFLVVNGDVLTDLDLTDMLRYHRQSGSICTIALTTVEDPTAYGLVDLDGAGRITRFTEKPRREDATSNLINAGTYLLESEVLAYIPAGEYHMVERGLFPMLLAAGKPLYGYPAGAYWIDIGTPAMYLQAQSDILTGVLANRLEPGGELFAEGVWVDEGTFIHSGAHIVGPVVLGKRCSLEEGASILGPAVLGNDCHVGKEAHLERLVAWRGVAFDAGSHCSDCIVAANARIGAGTLLEAGVVVGDNATIGAGNHLSGDIKLAPGTLLPDRQEAAGQ
jgi:mannose-1-phosphate guanylyltransferase